MTPTRELALQIYRECKKFCKPLNLRVVCVYGGTGISEQVRGDLTSENVSHCYISPVRGVSNITLIPVEILIGNFRSI